MRLPVVIDMYIPTHLENLERGGRSDEEYAQAVSHQVSVINEDLGRGDFFLCASERQRDFWLGALSHAGPGESGHLRPTTPHCVG